MKRLVANVLYVSFQTIKVLFVLYTLVIFFVLLPLQVEPGHYWLGLVKTVVFSFLVIAVAVLLSGAALRLVDWVNKTRS